MTTDSTTEPFNWDHADRQVSGWLTIAKSDRTTQVTVAPADYMRLIRVGLNALARMAPAPAPVEGAEVPTDLSVFDPMWVELVLRSYADLAAQSKGSMLMARADLKVAAEMVLSAVMALKAEAGE